MQDNDINDLKKKTDLLCACGRLKMWSVVVTVLGDLCPRREDWISGKLLTVLAARMGLSAQAVRVALHRLRNDGWIESEKTGRASCYRLSATGWQQAQAVRPVIYPGAAPEPAAPWIAIAPGTMPAARFAALLPESGVILGPRCALLAAPPPGLQGEILLARAYPGEIPRWVTALLASDALRADYRRLGASVARVSSGPVPQDQLDVAALRVLVLHQWRRLRLRHGPLPDMLLGEGWEGAEARRHVAAALAALARPPLESLAREAEADL